jgi:hypothetical protein
MIGNQGMVRIVAVISIMVIVIVAAFVSFRSSNGSTGEDSSGNIRKNGLAVHAYCNGQLSVIKQGYSSIYNTVSVQVNGFVLNPLNNSDRTSDYYMLDLYATASPVSGWYVTSNDFNDEHGPSLNVLIDCIGSELICLDSVCPQSLRIDNGGNSPQTNSLEISVEPVKFGISHTFTPATSKTQPSKITSSQVGWLSAGTTNGNPALNAYAYDFQVGLKVPKGTPASIEIHATASFYKITGSYILFNTYAGDSASLVADIAFNSPPVTTISSNPQGKGYVQVDGKEVVTPVQFIWDIDNSHTLAASDIVPRENGIRYVFRDWSDEKGQSHNIVAPNTETTFMADFQTQYSLLISTCQNGNIIPNAATYWYNVSQIANVTCAPESGYLLRNWILDGTVFDNATEVSIQMDSPHTLSAIFVKNELQGGTNLPSSLFIPTVASIAIIAAVLIVAYLRKRKA